MIPKRLIEAALKKQANIGREYDSQGKHIAFYLRVSNDWRVYRHSVGGMLAVLRQLPEKALQ